MTIADEINKRGISEVLHFTTNRGVTGTLHKGFLMSRPRLNEEEILRHVLQLNWENRPEVSADFDNSEDWIRFVNLSVSAINHRLFRLSRARHNVTGIWWCILGFDPEIMTHEGVYFATTNNGYDACIRDVGKSGIKALFAPKVQRKSSRMHGGPWSVQRGSRSIELPTCEQAEVLYPDQLDIEHLRKIYVEENEHHDMIAGLLAENGYENIKVLVEPNKFEGYPN